MLENSKAFSGFSVDDVERAKAFYTGTLGVRAGEVNAEAGLFNLQVGGDREVLVYYSPMHSPGSYTVLNFPVDDVDKAVDELTRRGVTFERYFDNQDERNILRGEGPTIAWFKDPAGNVLSVIEDN